MVEEALPMHSRNRFSTALLLTMLALAVSASAQKNSQWPEYKAADQGFAVSFPGTPESKSQPVSGVENATQYFYTLDLGDHAYLASVVDYGPGNGPGNPNQAYYTKLVNAYADGSSSTVKSQHATTISGHTGVEAVTY